jgi:exodeoxyribonuclease VII small subunit
MKRGQPKGASSEGASQGDPSQDADPDAASSIGPTASFEAYTERLAEIVEQLEGGELPLERSLELFEEGVGLARRAQSRLDAAERRVEELLGVDEDGSPVTRELDL